MYLLFDIGGTNTRLALSKDLDSIEEKMIFSTPSDYSNGINKIAEEITALLDGREITAASGCVAAVFDGNNEKIIRAPHLQDWENFNIKKDLIHLTDSKVLVRNDTDLAGLGEAVFGAGRDKDIVAYITLSTGIGGSRIVNRQIDRFTIGFEPGHQIIDADGSICPDCSAFEGGGAVGHWEALCSGSAIKKRFGKEAKEINDQKIWDEIAKLASIGINNTIVHWSPDVLVLGGGLMESEFLTIEKINKRLEDLLYIFPDKPEIRKAELGKFGALYGSLHYLKQNI